MKYLFCIIIYIFSVNNCLAGSPEKQELRNIIKSFSESIQNKDKERFLNLFIEKGASWVGVFSKKDMVNRTKLIKKINKEDNKNFPITRIFTETPKDFIERIIADDASPREEFSNIKILTDNNIATIYFDFIFYSDNKKEIWGSESWQLVKTMKGWKIQSVSYSLSRD